MARAAVALVGALLLLPLPPAAGAVHAQETHVLVVSGLGGDPHFREEFVAWGTRMVEGAEEAGVVPENIVFLAEDPEAAPGIRARSTREEVEAAIREMAANAGPDDRIFFMLIGHGSGADQESAVSLPGPSLDAGDYRALLDELAPRSVAVVNVASGSGDFARVLAGEGRMIVTATRSASQRNAPIFGGHFVEAWSADDADLDRDGRVSLLEAFEYARQETERHYRDRGLIASEQALLDDRPDGQGVQEPAEDDQVGRLAARFFLAPSAPSVVIEDEEEAARLRALYTEQDRLEDEIASLNARQSSMDPAEYQQALQALLVELSQVGQEIRQLEEGR